MINLKKKLENILLIDDSESDNFYHKRKLTKLGISDNIHVTYGGQEALDFLKEKVNGKFQKPILIFLDINMPGMNGWEFLEEYHKLEEVQKARVVLSMLSNSVDSQDKDRALSFTGVSEYISKPLSEDVVRTILETHFEDYLEK